jgi:hypothetical protein
MSETQERIDSLAVVTEVKEIDPAAIKRFVEDTVNRQPVDPADAMQAAVLMWGLMAGVSGGDDMSVELRRLLRKRKARVKKFDPSSALLGTPAWEIVFQYVRGNITHKDAVKLFQDEVCPASKRQCENWIAAIKPEVQITVDAVATLKASAENTAK